MTVDQVKQKRRLTAFRLVSSRISLVQARCKLSPQNEKLEVIHKIFAATWFLRKIMIVKRLKLGPRQTVSF